MPIKVKKIEPQTVECFDPEDNSLGFLNEYEFNDLRAQICETKSEGYYFLFQIPKNDGPCMGCIDKDGRYHPIPGLFEEFESGLMRLIKSRID